jgi:hypothetical protein
MTNLGAASLSTSGALPIAALAKSGRARVSNAATGGGNAGSGAQIVSVTTTLLQGIDQFGGPRARVLVFGQWSGWSDTSKKVWTKVRVNVPTVGDSYQEIGAIFFNHTGVHRPGSGVVLLNLPWRAGTYTFALHVYHAGGLFQMDNNDIHQITVAQLD